MKPHNQNDEPLFTYDQVTDAICFFHANGRSLTLSEMLSGKPIWGSEQRKYILSFKEEDPLLMAYVEGQKHPLPEHDARVLKEERERAFKVISTGKSALYEICPDGHWDQILQAKMDVLCWVEESLRRGEHQ